MGIVTIDPAENNNNQPINQPANNNNNNSNNDNNGIVRLNTELIPILETGLDQKKQILFAPSIFRNETEMVQKEVIQKTKNLTKNLNMFSEGSNFVTLSSLTLNEMKEKLEKSAKALHEESDKSKELWRIR